MEIMQRQAAKHSQADIRENSQPASQSYETDSQSAHQPVMKVNLPFAEIQKYHIYPSRKNEPVVEALRSQITHKQTQAE